ncbi:MAG: hypothetical protein ABEJ03_05725 [Candidatus Nanohaloarchaea archaeon]
MEVEKTVVEEGVRIEVRADREVAVSIRDGRREEIYLPNANGSDSTYYVEGSSHGSGDDVFVFVHHGEVDDLELISR